MKDLSNIFKGKKVILLGLGVSNRPLVKMLTGLGAEIEVRESKTREKLGGDADTFEALGAKLVLGEDSMKPIFADYIFRSPGFRPDLPVLLDAVKNGACLTSEAEMFLECAPCPVIGVTGSDGKSTTTTLIYKILEKEKKLSKKSGNVFLGGNIGFPLFDRVNKMTEDDLVAAEFSSFQLMTVKTPLFASVIKNVTPNHLNWHTGMDEYIAAKARILNGCGTAILNFDDEVCKELSKNVTSPIIWFSRHPIPTEFLNNYSGGAFDRDGTLTYYDSDTKTETPVVDRKDIILPGDHNAENYSTAIAATFALGLASKAAVREVAKTFPGVSHRFELVANKDGILFYNSSIDSSPTRTAAALSNLKCPIRIICGGYDKNIPFEPLAEALINHGNVKSVILTGATAEKIESCILSNKDFEKSGIELCIRKDFTNAVLSAASSAVPGDAVLLSPACASFDAFENFEKRGERFREIILDYCKNK